MGRFILIAGLLALTLWPGVSKASLPGTNGRIFYSIDSASGKYIQSKKSDGTDLQSVTNALSTDEILDPELSPTGDKILYEKYGSGSVPLGLYISNPDNSSPFEVIAMSSTVYINNATWSPDGMKIAYSKFVTSTPASSGIFIINRDGTGEVQVVANNTSQQYKKPSWSPDNTKLAISMTDSVTVGNGGIFTVNAAASSTPTQIVADTANNNNISPQWRPDGAKIGFSRATAVNTTNGLFIVNPDGSSETQLFDGTAYTGGLHVINFDWSPDGTGLVFNSGTVGMGGCCNNSMFRANGDGTNVTGFGNGTYPDWGVPAVAPAAAAPGLPDTSNDKTAPYDWRPMIVVLFGASILSMLIIFRKRNSKT